MAMYDRAGLWFFSEELDHLVLCQTGPTDTRVTTCLPGIFKGEKVDINGSIHSEKFP